MSRRDEIKKQIKKQDEEVYGDETVSGSSPSPDSDDSVADMVGDAMGEDAKEEVENPDYDGFNIADEIEEDEEDVLSDPHSGTPADDDDEEDEE